MNFEKVNTIFGQLWRKDPLTSGPQFGWLLSYWNLAGVPFSYGFGAVYMATHDPATYRYPTWVYVFLFVFLTTSHILCVSTRGCIVQQLTACMFAAST